MADYYQAHAREYFEETAHIDPSPFLGAFVQHLPPGARVLDVGCGAGGIMGWMKANGFDVTGFERSPGLAALARAHSGCPVIEGDFADADFSSLRVDAILCCGALVHVPHAQLQGVLANIVRAFCIDSPRPRTLYVSLKQGTGSATDSRGRTFFFWQDQALRPVFTGLGFAVTDFLRSPSADGEGKMWLGYVLVPAK